MRCGKLVAALVALVAVLALTACTGGDSLEGTNWTLESLNEQSVIAGTEITITFEGGEVSGSAGCNTYGGDYHAGKSDLSFGMIFSTLMACVDSSVMDQEITYMAALDSVASYSITGDRLEMFDGAGATILVFVAD